jgi:1,4-alpha-glucan branching enzyme
MAQDDLRLLADGAHPRPWQLLGAHLRQVDGVDGVLFRVWAPGARRVSVTGDFCEWKDTLPMVLLPGTGVWERFAPGMTAGERYQYVVHGADGRVRRKADPYGRWMEEPPAKASVVTPSGFAWSDADWLAERAVRDRQRSPMRIYEVHLGSWRRGPNDERLGYAELGPLLAEHCLRYGFTHIELMPIAEYPFGGSWGYQVTGFYSPTARYGTPDQLRRMIDQLHRSGIGVILDWVPAHFARDEHGLARFDGTPLYEHPDPKRGEHPDWGTLIFDFGRAAVRQFLLGNATYWLEEFHVDGLRVDAVASMLYLDYSRGPGAWKPNILGGNQNLEAIAFLRELNERCRDGMPGAITIAEESTAFAGVSRSVADGGLGFDFKWDLGWMHDTLEYYARKPDLRSLRRGRLTFRGLYLGAERWVLPLSHDEVVHMKGSLLGKMPGDRPQQFASLRSLLANQIGQPGKKLNFMGTELASIAEWNHDLPLPWHEAAGDPLQAALGQLVEDLGAAYGSSPALWASDPDLDGFAWIDGEGAVDPAVVAWIRRGNPPGASADLVVVVQNGAMKPAASYRLGLPQAGPWDVVLNTDSERYGGASATSAARIHAEEVPSGGQPASAVLTLPPLATLYLRPAP